MPSSDSPLKRTPLYDVHVALGARVGPFAGYEMPIQYSGIIEEHMAVRDAAGLFDVSHMGEVIVRGEGALDFVQRLVTNDVRALYPGKALYSVMCADGGGTVDDLLVYKLGEDVFMLVINAANVESDLAHMRACLDAFGSDCSLEDRTDITALIAVQGPRAAEIASRAAGLDLESMKPFHFLELQPGEFFDCRTAVVSRTGYTGEEGLEIYCDTACAELVWQSLMGAGAEHGLLPCGLGARDTLRLEAGYSLYGHELSRDITPLEAGLGWVVKLDKGDFMGREALAEQKRAGVPRRVVGFVLEDRGIPRSGYPITDASGTTIGEVTSGSQSPVLGRGIGLGLVPNEPRYTEPGSEIAISVRGRALRATVRKPPLHKS
jgi:aminomethyltransferase